MTIRGLLKTSGLAALATAMAVTALSSTPAYAKPGDNRGAHADRGDRGGDRGGRSASADRGDRGNRGGDRGDRGRSGGDTGGRSWSAPAPAPAPVTTTRGTGGRGDAGRGWTGGRSGAGGGTGSADRGRTGGWNGGDNRGADAGRSNSGLINGIRRDVNRDRDPNRDRDRDHRGDRDWRDGNHNGSWNNNGNHGHDWNNGNYRRWDRNWHSNNRYDWRGWRNSHRNTFHIGVYYSPYRNYSYRRLNIGFYLDSLFYSNRYWISDPYQYRLPDAYGPYRWVRYYDDALLVDIYSGEVVDVLYDFFW